MLLHPYQLRLLPAWTLQPQLQLTFESEVGLLVMNLTMTSTGSLVTACIPFHQFSHTQIQSTRWIYMYSIQEHSSLLQV